MREDIKQWVVKCAHCVAYHMWHNRKSELYFSLTITSPFWIIQTDLWIPGNADTDSRVNTGYLLNSLCNLTQFVVSTPTFNITASALAKLFMEEVLLTFGMCAVVVLDDGRYFKDIFKEMCEHLKLTYWCISWVNHKGNSAKNIIVSSTKTKPSQALIEVAMINLFKMPRPANIRGTAHRLTTLTSLVALPELEENLDFPLMWKSQQHQPSTLLPIAVYTIISAAYQMMCYSHRRY